MPTRRKFQIVVLSMGAAALACSVGAQQGDTVTARIRADETVRAVIPPIAERNLTIEQDQSEEAKVLLQRSPPLRASPIIFMITGKLPTSDLLQMVKELLRQEYYGGVLIDVRSQPPSVTSDPKIPTNTILVIDGEGKTSRFADDQFSLDALTLALKLK